MFDYVIFSRFLNTKKVVQQQPELMPTKKYLLTTPVYFLSTSKLLQTHYCNPLFYQFLQLRSILHESGV